MEDQMKSYQVQHSALQTRCRDLEQKNDELETSVRYYCQPESPEYTQLRILSFIYTVTETCRPYLTRAHNG